MKPKKSKIKLSLSFWAIMTCLLITIFLSSAISMQNATSQDTATEKKQEGDKVTESKRAEEEGELIDGDADEFEQREKEGVMILIGNVKINRQNGYLNADKVTIHRDVDTDDVIKTVAEGNVDMKDGDILAKCDHAVLNEVDDTIVLSGSVVVMQRGDEVKAPFITYNRKTGIRKGKGNDTERVHFKVRLKKKKETQTETEGKEEKTEK